MAEKKLTESQKKKIKAIVSRIEGDPNLISWVEMAFREYDRAIKENRKLDKPNFEL